MENGMEVEKNIIQMEKLNTLANIQMENGMEKEKNISKMAK